MTQTMVGTPGGSSSDSASKRTHSLSRFSASVRRKGSTLSEKSSPVTKPEAEQHGEVKTVVAAPKHCQKKSLVPFSKRVAAPPEHSQKRPLVPRSKRGEQTPRLSALVHSALEASQMGTAQIWKPKEATEDEEEAVVEAAVEGTVVVKEEASTKQEKVVVVEGQATAAPEEKKPHSPQTPYFSQFGYDRARITVAKVAPGSAAVQQPADAQAGTKSRTRANTTTTTASDVVQLIAKELDAELGVSTMLASLKTRIGDLTSASSAANSSSSSSSSSSRSSASTCPSPVSSSSNLSLLDDLDTMKIAVTSPLVKQPQAEQLGTSVVADAEEQTSPAEKPVSAFQGVQSSVSMVAGSMGWNVLYLSVFAVAAAYGSS